MNITQRAQLMQRWQVIQGELLPDLQAQDGVLTPKLTKVIHTLEWVRIEEFVSGGRGVGRDPHDRGMLANAFVAKAVLGLETTAGLIERLTIDRVLRRICGFPRWKRLPSESTFSRAFDEFAQSRLAERVHEVLVKAHLGEALIGHVSRDGTAIEAREKPQRQEAAKIPPATSPKKRGRPTRGEVREVQCPRLQAQLEWLQTAHRHGRLRRTGERGADQRLRA